MENTDKKYYVYKTTFLPTNEIYIGVRGSKDIDKDSYLGSGVNIKKLLEDHNRDKFSREVLFSYEDEERAYEKERELVNSDFLKKEKTLNIAIGGLRGVYSKEVRDLISETNLRKYGFKEGKLQSKGSKVAAEESRIRNCKSHNRRRDHYLNSKESRKKAMETKLCNSLKTGIPVNLNLLDEEVQRRAQETRLKRYGSKAGNLNNKESREKAVQTHILKAKNGDVKLDLPGELVFPDGRVIRDSLFNLGIIINGRLYTRIAKTIYSKAVNKTPLRNKHKGCYIRLVESSTTSAEVKLISHVGPSGTETESSNKILLDEDIV